MTQIKLCGLSRPEDIAAANALKPDFVGFVFAGSRRQVTPEAALRLRQLLDPATPAVGVFVDETPEQVANLLNRGVIQIAQLHGHEDEAYLARIRALAPGRPLWQAFRLHRPEDAAPANASSAEAILLDSGRGSGEAFDWALLAAIRRPYFLAGGLGPETVTAALNALHPYGVDVSSSIETDHKKDAAKMAAFVAAVRRGDALRGRALHLHLRRNRGGRADSARPAL